MSKVQVTYDEGLIDILASDFDLRKPNKVALQETISSISKNNYDGTTMQVLDMATGVGKTYLMAALIEYLRRQGVRNVLVVTPSLTVQNKTVQNFTPGEPRFISGAVIPPEVITPQDYSSWRVSQSLLAKNGTPEGSPTMLYIFNIQQLIAPTSLEGSTQANTIKSRQLRTRKFDESAGSLFTYLKSLDDLVVIADESHLYGSSATVFNASLRELQPAVTIGLTGSASPEDHVIYRYPLYQAIADRYVKTPVLAFRKEGYSTSPSSEEQQLKDALALRNIKQEAYAAYAEGHPEVKPINPVVFVVCADVSHATEIAGLLRTPEFFNEALAVLQVDNQHNDDQTLHRLDQIDSVLSPVRAVVSVNKLKEGWDVRSIGVLVTLRAMASDVLTQQTMGRGLRLPFGKYTGIFQIDQLDIIAHQSFKELLTAENVLQQFGLSDALHDSEDSFSEKIKEADEQHSNQTGMQNSKSVNSNDDESKTADNSEPEIGTSKNAPTVGVREYDSDENSSGNDIQFSVTHVAINPKFQNISFDFPRTVMQIEKPDFTLASVEKRDLEDAASRVVSSGDILIRKEIRASLSKKLSVRDTESAEVESVEVSVTDAEKELLKSLMRLQVIPSTDANLRIAQRYVIPTFINSVRIKKWTVKALSSAVSELEAVVKRVVNDLDKMSKEIDIIQPLRLPVSTKYVLPLGETVHDQISDSSHFRRHRYYDGWFKSLFPAESFDSYTGEYRLASLLNVSPNVVWWKRLHLSEGASIQYNLRQNYYPDFVVYDTSGTYWIVEGKSVRGRQDSEVEEKRVAAERVVRELLGDPAFQGQSWGYVLAFEDDVKKADTWDDLKVLAHAINI